MISPFYDTETVRDKAGLGDVALTGGLTMCPVEEGGDVKMTYLWSICIVASS